LCFASLRQTSLKLFGSSSAIADFISCMLAAFNAKGVFSNDYAAKIFIQK